MSYPSAIRRPSVEPLQVNFGTRLMAALRWLGRLGQAFHGRSVIADLGRLDDRMLRDIGLSRSDLRDAASVSPLEDPTVILFRRAAERRASRGRVPNAELALKVAERVSRKHFVPYY